MLSQYENLNHHQTSKVSLVLRISQPNCYRNAAIVNFALKNEKHYIPEHFYLNKIVDYSTDLIADSNPTTIDEILDINLKNKNLIILFNPGATWKEQLNAILKIESLNNIYLIRDEGDFSLQHTINIACDCNACLLNSINPNINFNFEKISPTKYNSGFSYSMLNYIKASANITLDITGLNPHCRTAKPKDSLRLKLKIESSLPVNPLVPSSIPATISNYYQAYLNLGAPRYISAPMVGQSELAFRMMIRDLKVNLCYTPMINAATFISNPEYAQELFQTNSKDRPLAVQLAGNDPQIILAAAQKVADQCDLIDLNLGCPQPVARRHEYGAWLMETPEKIKEIVSLLSANLSVPISCKIRIFEDVTDTIAYAQMLQQAGCSLLTIHGRLRKSNMNTEQADWNHIKIVKQNLNIPVIANGSITNLEQAEQCLALTGCDGVMAASHLLENLYLFTGGKPSPYEQGQTYLKYALKYATPLEYAQRQILQLCKNHLNPTQLAGIKKCHSTEKLYDFFSKLIISTEQFNSALNNYNAIDVVSSVATPSSDHFNNLISTKCTLKSLN